MAAVVVYGIIVIVVLGIILSLFAYVRVPNDKMAFISGFRKRMVSGRLAFYVRAFERVDYLDLAVFSVDVDTKQFVPTNDFINIKADAIVKLQVGTTQDIMLIASKNFLNKNHEYMSNAIVLSKDGQLIASGVGQTSRVDALQQAIAKARHFGFDLHGAVLSSDAFFPFDDCVTLAAEAGITAIAQPGGSVRDADSIAAADRLGVAMVMTGVRHFKH